MNPLYPFSAIVGQDELKLALILNAIDPSIGGVLIRGERGTAKSTTARGLATLLPPTASDKPAPFVELPLGATEDRVVGSLDVESALREGRRELRSGLLAKAHDGVLYVDEVNLLPDHLVDLLLDAAASGRVTIERDGVSASDAAGFVLLGSMNPEEGELRPQFLDRFGLCVEIKAPAETAPRVETIRQRLAYEAAPETFCATWESAQQALRTQILGARARLASVRIDDSALGQAAGLCAHLKLNGVRGDLTLVKTARALAAWENAPAIANHHLQQAARLALPHRKRRKPFEPVDSNNNELERFFQTPTPPATGKSTDDPSSGTNPPPPEESGSETPAESPAQTTPERPAAASAPAGPVQLAVQLAGSSSSGRRPAQTGAKGGVIRSMPLSDAGTMAIAATLEAAAVRGASLTNGGLALQAEDLRQHERAGRSAARVLFVVDASGSMAAERRLSLAKGAATGLLTGSYQRRDEVALMIFRGNEASLLLPFTRAVERAEQALCNVPTGGRTPLALALAEASNIARTSGPLLVVLFTDGRANVGHGNGDPWQEAVAGAQTLSTLIAGAVVIDCETGPVRLERASQLANALGAECIQLDKLDTTGLTLRLQRRMSGS